MTSTIHTLAAEMSHAFERATRPTSGETFVKLKDDAPAWMSTVCRKAHDDGELLPEDWRYQFIEQAVDALAEHDDAESARNSLEPDIYTSELTGWLDSLNSRVYYLGAALAEFGQFDDGFKLLAAAQIIEKEEVFQQVVAALLEELASRGVESSDQGKAPELAAGEISYSVLLLYPDYAGDYGTETYYAFVHAADPLAAVELAQQQAAAAQDGVEIEPADFHPLLVIKGHHASQPLFNQ